MDWAFDRVSRQLIQAHLAHEGEPQRYICPTKTCQGRVFLRRGKYRRDHFAHNQGEGSVSCEDYHPGAYDATSNIESTDIDELRSLKQVALELAVRKQQHWKLRCRLPATAGATGIAEFRYGPDDAIEEIELSALRHRAHIRDVIPCADNLGIIRFRSNVPSGVRDALTPSTITLSMEKYTFFHSGRLNSLGIVGPAYYWGASYYILGYADAVPEPRRDILVKSLGKRTGWRCDLIRLPQEPIDEIVDWLAKHSGLAVGTRRAKVLLVSPPLFIEKPGPEIETIAEKVIVLGIHRLGRESLNDKIYIEDEHGVTSLPVHNRDNAAVEIRLPDKSERCLYVRFGTEPGLLINLRKTLGLAPSRVGTRLSAVNRSTKRRRTVALGTIAARTLLRGVQLGEYASLKVATDEPTHIELLKLSTNGRVQQTEIVFIADENSASEFIRRLTQHSSALLIAVPGQGTQYLGARRRPLRKPYHVGLPVDKSDAALRVHLRYSNFGYDTSGDHIQRSAAQIIADRYARNDRT